MDHTIMSRGIWLYLLTAMVLQQGFTPPSAQAQLVAAVLPSSRSVQVGLPATAFAALINTGTTPALDCGIAPQTPVPATFTFQRTDPATNAVTGTPNTLVSIPAGQTQSFLFAFTPTAAFAPREVQLQFACTNTAPAPIITGLNTVLLSASQTPVPDIVALAATLQQDGIVHVRTTGAFAVATVNVGAAGTITASVDTGETRLPVVLSLCATQPTTGACLAPPAASVTTQIAAGATPTFGIFVEGRGDVPFDPATNRVTVRFRDTNAVTRGATSVAVQTVGSGGIPLTVANFQGIWALNIDASSEDFINDPDLESPLVAGTLLVDAHTVAVGLRDRSGDAGHSASTYTIVSEDMISDFSGQPARVVLSNNGTRLTLTDSEPGMISVWEKQSSELPTLPGSVPPTLNNLQGTWDLNINATDVSLIIPLGIPGARIVAATLTINATTIGATARLDTGAVITDGPRILYDIIEGRILRLRLDLLDIPGLSFEDPAFARVTITNNGSRLILGLAETGAFVEVYDRR